MTTPLSKMVALLIPSPLTPKRGLGSAGSLSEAKKGVAKVCGDRSSSVGDYSRQRTPSLLIRGRLESPKDLQGLKDRVKHSQKRSKKTALIKTETAKKEVLTAAKTLQRYPKDPIVRGKYHRLKREYKR